MDEKNEVYKSVSSGLLGFATGDAMGVPIEFTSRMSHEIHPLTEMVGYGSHPVPEGTWSDDTSMTIAAMDSIRELKDINYDDIMNRFCAWFLKANYTATDKVFDIGIGTRNALASYYNHVTPAIQSGGLDEKNNGNGSLMRMLPVVYYLHYANLTDGSKNEIIKNYSSLTHGHEISKLGCKIYYDFMDSLLSGKSIKDSYESLKNNNYSEYYSPETISKYSRVLDGSLENVDVDSIQSSGYVVSTLEAALWVSLHSDNYEDAVVKSINLGDDTDTVGAITGSIVGVAYGKENIPERWLSKLKKLNVLEELSLGFSETLKEISEKHSYRFYDDASFNGDDELFRMLTSGTSSGEQVDTDVKNY